MHIVALALACAFLVGVFGWQIWRLVRPGPVPLTNPVLYFGLIFLSLLALRLPIINLPVEINVDESQMVAQAMRFESHPVPWRDVDGTTSGPLNSLVLTVPLWLGASASWQEARLVHCALVCLTLVFLYLTLRSFGTELEARLALWPTIFFYAFALYTDFCHYSSETLSVLLLAAGFSLLAREWVAGVGSRARLFFLGVVCGAVPFAKLQAAPLALLLAAGAAALLVVQWRKNQSSRAAGQAAGSLVLGAVVIPGIILGVVTLSGAFNDFWISYIQANASYTQEESLGHRIKTVGDLLASPSDFRPYLVGVVGAIVILVGVRLMRKSRDGKHWSVPFVFISAYVALTVFCVLLAGKCFNHHFLLLIPALATVIGLAFIAGTSGNADARVKWAFVLCLVVAGFQLYKLPNYVQKVSGYVLHPKPAQLSELGQRVRSVSRPGDTMSVWGWMPVYYVETGLVPATRDAIGHRVISPSPNQEYYRRRYLADFEKSKPAVFIDAVGQGEFTWGWTAVDRHENFVTLANLIAKDYALWLSLQTDGSLPLRIYVLKSRLAELKLSPTDAASSTPVNQ